MKYSFKHRIEYLLLLCVLMPLGRLPYRFNLGLMYILAWITHHIGRFRVAAARERIREVLGEETPPREVRRIAWISWRNLCFNLVEMARVSRMKSDEVLRFLPGFEEVFDSIKEFSGDRKGFVLATIHMGSWELGGLSLTIWGVPVFAIARRQKNPLTDRLLTKMRTSLVMNDSRVLRNVIRKLKAGNVLAILPDVRARTEALKIEYLGKEANLGGGMAMFARQTNLPIVPTYGIREGWTRHRWQLLDPVYPDLEIDKRKDWERMTQEIMNRFTGIVRQHPEQYFWYNKRWVLEPLGEED